MSRTVGIGHQDFATVRMTNNFYIDKTDFIRKWWESNDEVTLIARPRRFGKTLNISMMEKFFSIEYAKQGELFEGLSIWKEEKYRQLQGSYPVICVSFANVKEISFQEARKKICYIIETLYNRFEFLLDGELLKEKEKRFYHKVSADMEDYVATSALGTLCEFLCRYYRKKVIILLDEYDTPLQEAFVNGYWHEISTFIRSLFNSAFKTNPYLERAIMTGITRVSKESIFSDLNNLEVVTSTSEKYSDCFGFTEKEVFAALDEFGLSDQKMQVKKWYDGFVFGDKKELYNPWSIINFLDKRKIDAYWANTSSNSLVGKLVQEGSRNIKEAFETLLKGESIQTEIEEQMVYQLLENEDQAIFSLLLASGYLKVKTLWNTMSDFGQWKQGYELELTNFEVKVMFERMIRKWFGKVESDYNDFIRALCLNDVEAMNEYMNRVAFSVFSYFDTGKEPSKSEPERFYHGFVLGLMVELADRYILTSNRESGFGRYDVMLEPRRPEDDGMILEFKVFQPRKEKDLQQTAEAALQQIEQRQYAALLMEKGVPKEKIKKYGFAFCGNKVQIVSAIE